MHTKKTKEEIDQKQNNCKHLGVEKMGGDVSLLWPDFDGHYPIWWECLDCGKIWNTEKELKQTRKQI
jgi:hypothetical protein